MNVNGRLTLGENIADNGGIRTAFHAYRLFSLAGSEPRAFASLSNDQLFFVAFAQTWCTKRAPASEELLLLRDPHSPAAARVIGALSNLADFSTAFSCPVGSAMNPPAKCVLW